MRFKNRRLRRASLALTRAFTILLASVHSPTNAAEPLNVMIDPGHGGRDHGAVRGGIDESSITLNVSKLLAERLRQDRARFRVKLTRDQDETLTLPERARRAHHAEADVFISIHVNSSPDQKAQGAEFYFQNQLPPDEESMRLAHRENSADDTSTGNSGPRFLLNKHYAPEVTTILGDLLDGDRILLSSQLSKTLKQNWRGSKKSKSNSVRQAPFFVLSQTQPPSTLVELGFLTNADDLKRLTDPAVQAQMADDLYRGLKAYQESGTDAANE